MSFLLSMLTLTLGFGLSGGKDAGGTDAGGGGGPPTAAGALLYTFPLITQAA